MTPKAVACGTVIDYNKTQSLGSQISALDGAHFFPLRGGLDLFSQGMLEPKFRPSKKVRGVVKSELLSFRNTDLIASEIIRLLVGEIYNGR